MYLLVVYSCTSSISLQSLWGRLNSQYFYTPCTSLSTSILSERDLTFCKDTQEARPGKHGQSLLELRMESVLHSVKSQLESVSTLLQSQGLFPRWSLLKNFARLLIQRFRHALFKLTFQMQKDQRKRMYSHFMKILRRSLRIWTSLSWLTTQESCILDFSQLEGPKTLSGKILQMLMYFTWQ